MEIYKIDTSEMYVRKIKKNDDDFFSIQFI